MTTILTELIQKHGMKQKSKNLKFFFYCRQIRSSLNFVKKTEHLQMYTQTKKALHYSSPRYLEHHVEHLGMKNRRIIKCRRSHNSYLKKKIQGLNNEQITYLPNTQKRLKLMCLKQLNNENN